MKQLTSLFAFLGLVVFVGAGCAPASVEEPIQLQVEPSTVPMEEPIVNSVQGDVSLSDFTAPPTTFPGILVKEERLNRSVVVHTSKGDITLTLFGDEAPAAVSNFLILANTGFYDGVRFHRIIKDFMIQSGDPQSKDVTLADRWGTGGTAYRFPDELGRGHNTYEAGTLAMANSGPNTNGSQFFIMHNQTPIPNLYTIFGQVTDGMDVVNALATVETSGPPSDKPLTPPVIESIEILPVE